MKFFLYLACFFTFTHSAFANAGDYKDLLPPTPVRATDLKALAERTDALLESLKPEEATREEKAEYDAIVKALIVEKDEARREAEAKISACDKNYECVRAARSALEKKIAEIHERLRKAEEVYKTARQVAKNAFAKAEDDLALVLKLAMASFLTNEIEQALARKEGIQLESHVAQEYMLRPEDFGEWYKKFPNYSPPHYLTDSFVGASFFFRDAEKQVHVGFVPVVAIYCAERFDLTSWKSICKKPISEKSYYYLSRYIKDLRENELPFGVEVSGLAGFLVEPMGKDLMSVVGSVQGDAQILFHGLKLVYDQVRF